MKSYLFSIALLLICSVSIAQSQTTVYLKDGSKVKGAVLVNDSTGFVMVISEDNSYHYYLKNQVAKMGADSIKSKRVRSYTLKQKGYLCNIEMGISSIFIRGGQKNNLTSVSFDITNSYLISPIASIGMGVGTQLSGNIEMFSVYADSRIYFIKSDIAPYIELALGYNTMFFNGGAQYYERNPSIVPGLVACPSLGVRVATGKRVALTASIGWKLYYLHNTQYYGTYENFFLENGNYTASSGSALSLKAGFQF